jgi:uncharacterized protein (DUF1778 family)
LTILQNNLIKGLKMATQAGHTMVQVSIETRDMIRKVADADGRSMKWLVAQAVKDYAKKHGLTYD